MRSFKSYRRKNEASEASFSIGDPLVASFNESFAKGTMSPSQRQAVITLIEKKDQDRYDLGNWRPISLLNVDAKLQKLSPKE